MHTCIPSSFGSWIPCPVAEFAAELISVTKESLYPAVRRFTAGYLGDGAGVWYSLLLKIVGHG